MRYCGLAVASFICLLLFILASDSIQSAQTRGAEKYALIVGINSYQNKAVNPLNYAINDAKQIKKILIDRMAFNEQNIYLFTSDKKGEAAPTLTNIVFALESIREDIKPGGTFFFFFSGHGISMEGESFLLTMEADPRSRGTLDVSSLKVAKVREIIGKMKADRILLFIDACRTDPGGNKGTVKNLMSKDFSKNLLLTRGGGESSQVKAAATLFSCSVGESSYEWQEKSQGFFTYHLISALKGEAANSNGEITLNSLENYLTSQVPAVTKKWVRQRQTPWMERSGSGAGTWVLARGKKGQLSDDDSPGGDSVASQPIPQPSGNEANAGPSQLGLLVAVFESNVKWESVNKEWSKRRDNWVNEIRASDSVSVLAGLLMEFESNILWDAVDEKWKARREVWCKECSGATSLMTIGRLVKELESYVKWTAVDDTWKSRRDAWMTDINECR